MSKRTFASVTETLCDCGWLEDSASDPELPIVFDEAINELQIEYSGRSGEATGVMVIYHCPFCGGAAPESKRDQLFAKVSTTEEYRLNELLKDIKTMDDAIEKLGRPEIDNPHGCIIQSKQTEKCPTITQNYRSLMYSNLSDVANVILTDFHKERIHISYQGKFLGVKNDQ